jgi:cell wall-associated NlpC family hydrolase
MPRLLKIIMAFILVFSFHTPPAGAQYSAAATTLENLRLRAQPSLTAAILTTAPRGETVTITRREPAVNADGSWYLVTYNGISGFMSADFLSIQSSSAVQSANGGQLAPSVQTAQLNSANLNAAAPGMFAAIGRTTGSLRLRAQPSLSARVLATASNGASVAVTQQDTTDNGDGEWYSVVYNGVEGFMSADFLIVTDHAAELKEIGFIKEPSVNFRTLPSTESDRIQTLSVNTRVEITGIQNGWYAVRHNNTNGFVRADLVTLATDGFTPVQSAPRATALSSGTGSNGTAHAKATSTLDSEGVTGIRRQIVEESLKYLGKPYRFAAAGPNAFDCSGLTVYIFGKFGYKLNRSSADQYRNTGKAVSKGDLLPGDLVYFRTTSRNAITHVGIYIGGGQFVHASSGRSRSVVISPINTGYYRDRYVGAKRVL